MAGNAGKTGKRTASEAPQTTFQAGDLILECEPWIWTVEWNKQNVLCASCCRMSPDLKTCQGCQVYRYCNKDCQIVDWKNGHKFDCPMLKRINQHRIEKKLGSDSCDSLLSMDILMLLKILNHIKGKVECCMSGCKEKKSAEEILKIFPSDSTYQQKLRGTVQTKFFRGLFEAAFPAPTNCKDRTFCESDMIDISAKIHTNAHWLIDYTEDRPRPFGYALYPNIPKGSMPSVCSDHNVIVVSQGKRLRMLAIEDIPRYSGLQDARCCSLNRFPFNWPVKQRRELFRKEFGPVCCCQKCTPEYEAEVNPLKCVTVGCSERIPSDERALKPCEQCGAMNGSNLEKLRNILIKYEELFAECADMPENRDSDDSLMQRLQLFEELDAKNVLQPEAHLRFISGWNVGRWYEKTNRFKEAWKLYHELTACIRMIFPKYHLHRAQFLHWAGMCPFNWFQSVGLSTGNFGGNSDQMISARSALSDGMNYLQEALEIYANLYGNDCSVVHEITGMMNMQRMFSTRV